MVHRSVFTWAELVCFNEKSGIGKSIQSPSDAGNGSPLEIRVCLNLERCEVSQWVILEEFQDKGVLPRCRYSADPQLIFCHVSGVVEDIQLARTNRIACVGGVSFAHVIEVISQRFLSDRLK